MKMVQRFLLCFATVVLATGGCSQQDSEPHTVRLEVTEHGFTPLEVEAHKGVPLTLLVTRQSEASCAKEIMIEDVGIRRSLPIRQEVRIAFTPERRGLLRYTCCDDMEGGRIVVR